MNFIAHYHYYKTEDSYYNLGLVLPDLVKSFCKTHLKPAERMVHPQMNALNQGSIIHLKADKLFHNSFYFTACEKHLSELVDSKAQWPRKWFLNHLLCEILLDRIIIDKYPDICEQFYNDLSSTNQEQVALYLKLNGINNFQNFAIGLEKFVTAKFIFDYKHNEKILLALSRVYQRLGIDYEWTDYDKSLLLESLPIQLEFMSLGYEHLKTELKID
jgi:hypothetical protein